MEVTGVETHGDGNLRKQLAAAVRSIQWNYAIFWSLSSTQQGVLEWGDGYYNGDIKTRKTVQSDELSYDKTGLLRSEQLRQLFETLQEEENDQQQHQAKRPSASLSPEDLTDEEWYYLVCMSFVFNPAEGMVGRAFAIGDTIWLCDAQYADSKVFSRSLLAKSASIQTVVCFPHLGGVVELGVTELVEEDPSLLQHVKLALLEFSKPICSFVPQNGDRHDHAKEPMCLKIENNSIEKLATENKPQGNMQTELDADSPTDCSYGCEHNHDTEDSFMVEGINGGAVSQVQSWHLIDDDFSNGFQGSMNSSDCVSEAKVKPINNLGNKHALMKLVQECNPLKLGSLDLSGADDSVHYMRTVSDVLKSSSLLKTQIQCLRTCGCKSSFIAWKISKFKGSKHLKVPQDLLKKILFKVPVMHGSRVVKSQPKRTHKDVILNRSGNLSLNKSENDKFLVLRSIVPSITEIDKASILDDTILYLKELEARVEELESCMDSTDIEGRSLRKFPGAGEETSDNYEIGNAKKPWINKRKASDIEDKLDGECSRDNNRALGVDVKIKGLEVSIEIRCVYREYLLLDVMEALNNLHLDASSVQSSTLDGILTLIIKSKFRGAAMSPAGTIKQALWKITGKC